MACSVFIPRTQSASPLVPTLPFRATTVVDSTPSFRRVASLFTVNLSHFHFYTFGVVFCCFTPSCLGVIVVCTKGFVFSLFGAANVGSEVAQDWRLHSYFSRKSRNERATKIQVSKLSTNLLVTICPQKPQRFVCLEKETK
ncbi:uncharacterized protein G2W53_031112 [Senna tora]|uniref:Uncharacterized protein n=1 Tax=Senna tora TaxID=362788 RepID=A0A834WDL8_9FABA|nr:uncharacterized protein G2W53_031112 [Senna tora]